MQTDAIEEKQLPISAGIMITKKPLSGSRIPFKQAYFFMEKTSPEPFFLVAKKVQSDAIEDWALRILEPVLQALPSLTTFDLRVRGKARGVPF